MGISGVLNTALSGMSAQQTKIGATAANIANAQTPDYQRLKTDLSTAAPTGGVTATVRPEGTGVDYATEMTDMIEAAQSYKANASVFETGADMWDVLMTIKRD